MTVLKFLFQVLVVLMANLTMSNIIIICTTMGLKAKKQTIIALLVMMSLELQEKLLVLEVHSLTIMISLRLIVLLEI